MSLIPYSHRDDEQSVVLRHQQTLVLYDPQSQELALREVQTPAATALELVNCPYCHRALNDSDPHVNSGRESLEGDGDTSDFSEVDDSDEPRYVDPFYFRMLQASNLPPPTPTLPTTVASSPPELRSRLQHARVEEADDSPSSSFISTDAPFSPRAERISKSAFSPNYFKRFFRVERELGRGGSGVVLLVKHVLDGVSLGHFACKRVPVGNDHAWLEKVLNEVQLLQQLQHMNLVSYRHVWLEDMELGEFQPSVPCAFILQQYCNSGDLHTYVLGKRSTPTKDLLKERMRRKSRGQPDLPSFLSPQRRLTFSEILSFFRDIASGLNHLHKNGFIHRDLKPSNCLLNDSGLGGGSYPRVLLSDFGEVQKENSKRRNTGATGTISYCAPEVLRKGPDGTYSNFTAKSDVFALGLILYFMCFNKLPYTHADEENEENEDIPSLRAEISAWRGLAEVETLRTDLPDQLYKSLSTLLSPNPDIRPSAEEILRQLEIFGPEFSADADLPRATKFRSGPMAAPRVARSLNGGPTLNAPNRPDDDDFHRISPIADTPPHSRTPVPSNGRRMMNLAARHSRLRSSANTSNTSLDRSPERPEPSSAAMDRSQSWDEGSVVVRRRGSSAVVLPPPSSPGLDVGRRSGSPVKQRSPRLMPPVTLNSGGMGMGMRLGPLAGSRGGWVGSVMRVVGRPEVVMGVKVAVFLGKAFSVYRPCSPLAPYPWIHFLVLGVGVLDFAGWFYSRSIVLLVIHFVILLTAGATGTLCPY